MSIYLTQLADVLRGAGLWVTEYGGWQSRARSSGGYANMPLCVMWHHTASPSSWNGQKDADYIAVGDSSAPLANLYIDRTGLVWVLAAGATNTNGKGYAMSFSRGQVPNDRMNEFAIGIELGNDGIGEAYPVEQINAVFAASNACNAMCGNQPTDVGTHNAWAPDRKIDPATAFAVQGPWQPGKANSSGTWVLGDVRAECAARAGTYVPPTPEPGPPIPFPTEDDDMLVCALDANGTAWVGNGINRLMIGSEDVFTRYIMVWRERFVNTSGKRISGWQDVGTGDNETIAALGFA